MKTIKDIEPDKVIYPTASSLVFLLYQTDGESIAISLPNAHLMSFVQVFSNTTECLDCINTNGRKTITLFVVENCMEWLKGNLYLKHRPQVNKIYIFCSSSEKQQRWTSETEDDRVKIQEPLLHNKLDWELLYFGLGHVEKVRQQCRKKDVGDGVLNRLKEDERKIWRAFVKYYEQKYEIEDKNMKLGVQPQS
jgi:hypothetical protein